MAGRERVLSGMRPSGRLHLGNYLGALANWVKLQDDYECFYFSADWHVAHRRTRRERRARATRSRWPPTGWAPASIPSARRCSSSRWCPSTPSCTCSSRWSRRSAGWSGCRPTRSASSSRGSDLAVLRAARLSAAAVGGHPHVQGQVGAGGHRPGAARRADARSGAPLQHGVRAGVPRAGRQADRDPQGAGDGRPQDVEVVRQRHRARGLRPRSSAPRSARW